MRRGMAACEAEWKLLCGTHNLLKLWCHTGRQPAPCGSPPEPRGTAAPADSGICLVRSTSSTASRSAVQAAGCGIAASPSSNTLLRVNAQRPLPAAHRAHPEPGYCRTQPDQVTASRRCRRTPTDHHHDAADQRDLHDHQAAGPHASPPIPGTRPACAARRPPPSPLSNFLRPAHTTPQRPNPTSPTKRFRNTLVIVLCQVEAWIRRPSRAMAHVAPLPAG